MLAYVDALKLFKHHYLKPLTVLHLPNVLTFEESKPGRVYLYMALLLLYGISMCWDPSCSNQGWVYLYMGVGLRSLRYYYPSLKSPPTCFYSHSKQGLVIKAGNVVVVAPLCSH